MQTRTIQELIVNQKLITIHQTARVRWAAKVMARHKISALPVVKEGFVIGIVTERDIVQKMFGCRFDAVRCNHARYHDTRSVDHSI